MARDFVPVDREQLSLLPSDMGEWLEGDHLAWFVIEVVDRLDLSGLVGRYQLGGVGRRAYHPSMLLALLIYAYSQGERSSRRIERGCRTDAAYRVICGRGSLPDHSTLSRFRQRHQDDIVELFSQVVRLAQEMGMARLGVLAVDGTKVAANAALGANRTEDWLRARIGELLAEAAATDEAEDAVFGDDAGDEMPAGLADPEVRAARLQEALDALAAKRPDDDGDGGGGGRAESGRVNLTDPDSAVMTTAGGGFVQGYNCQVAVSEDGIVVAARVSDQANDYGQLGPMLLEASLRCGQTPEVVLADAGYFDTGDLTEIEASPGAPLLLVATGKRADQPTRPGVDPEAVWAEAVAVLDAADDELRRRRAAVLERWDTGEIGHRQAAAEMGVSVPQAYVIRDRWQRGGAEAIPVPNQKRPSRPAPSAVMRYRLDARLADPVNRRAYKQRGHQVETSFARIKEHQKMRQFSRRGAAAVNAEFTFGCIVHNLLRLRTALA